MKLSYRQQRRLREKKLRPFVLSLETLEDRQLLYGDPLGGWDYIFAGNAAANAAGFGSLDGTWSHDNGSDQWDGSIPGSGQPGGAGVFTDGGSDFLRIQDTGDPRDYGMPDPSNRKLYFAHNIGSDGGSSTNIDTGMTITFRTRLSTTGAIDELHPNGGGGTQPWPANGDGYALNFGGKANFNIHQSAGGTIGFSLATTSDGAQGSPGLIMNNLNGTALTQQIDTGNSGTHNQFDLADPTAWHEFWITVKSGGAGTHQVTVYADSDLDGTTFDVTGGTGSDYALSYIAMGVGSTNDGGAFDVDFFGWKDGVHSPTPDGDVRLATVLNTPATDVGFFTADIGGEVTDDGGQPPQVTLYWGDNDAGTNAAAWDNAAFLGQQSGAFSRNLTGLAHSTQYFYRSLATNLAGDAWTSPTASFTTQAVAPPTIITTPATFIQATTADIGGEIVDDGGVTATVTMYFGDEDGGTDTDDWDQEIILGQQPGVFETMLEDLSPNTTYFYRASATNIGGTSWTSPAASFATTQVFLPMVTNIAATSVGAASAVLNGNVSSTGNDPPQVTIFYGDNNGGTNADAWDSSTTLAGKQNGLFATEVVGLQTNTTYFYSARATNLAGEMWAAPAEGFTTRDLPNLVLNEVVADNGTLETRTRANTEVAYAGPQTTPDWIEIHNPDDGPVDIAGLSLTDDSGEPTKWTFPIGTTIPGHGYLIVFASGEDITDPQLDEQGMLHTNFRLDSTGEYVALTDHSGGVIHELDLPNQFRDISYGLDTNFEEFYFETATPGSANTLGQLSVKDTSFSVDRGFYSDPFSTEITTATEGATVIYTLDGTPPSATVQGVVTNGIVYDGPIAINTTTTLRAMAFKAGLLSTNVDTQTYIFPADVLQQSGADVPAHRTWGHAGPDWEMDPEVVNRPENDPDRLRESDLTAIPSISLVMDWDDMFGNSGIYINGEKVRRATSFEYIDPSTGESVQANGAVEIQGGSSTGRWKSDKLSMRVRFREDFGPTKLNFPIFGNDATSSFDTLNIDAQLNYVWTYGSNNTQRSRALYIHDQMVSDLHNAVTGETQSGHGRYTHVYINGIYWGMHTLHERPDESWAAEYFGGDKEEYHAINQNRSINDGINPDGTPSASGAAVADLNAMVSLAQAAGNGGLAQWEALKQVLDVDQFIDYLLVNWYTGNGDWGNTKNWYASRKNTPDGRWRFHSWDAEKAFENFSSGGRDDVGNGPKGLHDALSGNDEYLLLFADHIQRHMFNDGALMPANAAASFQTRVDEVESAIRAESARWGDNRETREYVRSDLMNNFNSVLNNFFPGRTERVLNQLRSAGIYPSLEAPEFQINGTGQHGGAITIGDSLTITADADVITNDTVLVTQGSPAVAFVPTNNSLETGAGPLWYDVAFDAAGWISGTNGVGYENSGTNYQPFIGTDVRNAWNATTTSVYTRFEFEVDGNFNAADFDGFELRMKYDDGYVAYLNGQAVASKQAPSPAEWNTFATSSRSDALATAFEPVDITNSIDLLHPGTNVLAVHILNTSPTSSDLLGLPELVLTEEVTISSAPIVYTLDGSDPRAAGGAAVGNSYDGEIPLTQSTAVNARTFVNGQWSAVSTATFVVPAGPADIVITEVSYNPHDPTAAELAVDPTFDNDDFEFIEIHNSHPLDSLNLLDLKLTDGVQFDFPSVTLAAGDYAVVVENAVAFQARYGTDIQILGEWSGGLSNNGETIELVDGLGNRIIELDYRDGDPWATRADGFGATLELVDPGGTPTSELGKHYRWQGSANAGGTPGAAAIPLRGVVINEVLARTDNTSEVDAIELFNPTSQAIDIGGWYLSDSGNNPLKYQIPTGTVLAAGDYLVIDARSFGAGAAGFALSGTSGDDVWLVISDGHGGVGEFIDDVHFGASKVLTTIGRVPNGTGRLAPLGRNTLSCANTHASIGPMIISEVNFNPGEPTAAALQVYGDLVEDDLEFVEIYNPTSAMVDLTDWRLRGGADYDFDDGTSLGAGRAIVIVSFDPATLTNADRLAAFREHYNIGDTVTLVGGYTGELSDSGEAIRILRPGTPPADDPLTVPRTTDDEVLYDDLSPWYPASDGNGDSLHRLAPSYYGSSASSWAASNPTPGTVVFAGHAAGDLTGDGLVTAADIDVLLDAVHAGGNADFYDLDASGTVATADVDFLLENLLGTSAGDANLDGRVDSLDLNQVGINWQRTGGCLAWTDGNFNGDDIVSSLDLNLMAIHWQSGVAAARVPRAPLAGQIATPIAHSVGFKKMDYDEDNTSKESRDTSSRCVTRRQAEVVLRRWEDHSQIRWRTTNAELDDIIESTNGNNRDARRIDELLADWDR